jgi:hypothetical protein
VNSEQITKRALELVARTGEPKALLTLIKNAKYEGNFEVERAARLRLYAVLPSEAPGTLEHDIWQSIFALEAALSDERGKSIRLSRTRQKIVRDGELKCVTDLILGKPSKGFQLLVEREMLFLTFEAVALRHPEKFSEHALSIATERLESVGYNRALV